MDKPPRWLRIAVALALLAIWAAAFFLPFGESYDIDIPSTRQTISGVNATLGSVFFGNIYERFAWLGNVLLPLGLCLALVKTPPRWTFLALAVALAAIAAGAFGWRDYGMAWSIDDIVEVGGGGYRLWVAAMFGGAIWLAIVGALRRTRLRTETDPAGNRL